MTLKAKGIVCFEPWVANNCIVLGTPLKKPFVPDGFAFGTLALVFRIDCLAKVTIVRKVQRDVVGVKPFFEACDFVVKRAKNLLKVRGNRDQVFTPVQLCFVC